MSDQDHVIEVLNEDNRRLFEENARLREENEGMRRAMGPTATSARVYLSQRDTLLAAGKRYLYALSVANGTTGPDDRQDALEGLETAISEVEGEK